jgi:alpha/beta superfamily hydrolase
MMSEMLLGPCVIFTIKISTANVLEGPMGVVGKSPNPRRRVRVKATFPDNAPLAIVAPPSSQEAAAYIAEICVELVRMAQDANLTFVAHLLAMAQAEAESAAD